MRIAKNIEWRKSSRCDSGNCVEVGHVGDTVALRDSKHPDGPSLRFTIDEWRAFVDGIRDGEFD